MIWLINYFRCMFCKHEFEKSEKAFTVSFDGEVIRDSIKISLLCKKCGYHKSFWKF